MPEEDIDLTDDLLAAMQVVQAHVDAVAQSLAAEGGGTLSPLDDALARLSLLVPMLLDDYENAWDVADQARAAHQLLRESVGRTESGIILPS